MRAEVSQSTGTGYRPRRSTPRILIGILLLVVGVGWLFDAADVIDFPTRLVAPGALILVGLILLAQARRHRNGGLIVIGAILTLLLTLTPNPAADFAGGLGERVETPLTAIELQTEYALGVGSFTLDLSEVDLPDGSTAIEARVGVGQLVVLVPGGVDLVVEARTGAGEITILGRRVASGVGASVDDFREESFGDEELRLGLRVGLGPIRVSHGTT